MVFTRDEVEALARWNSEFPTGGLRIVPVTDAEGLAAAMAANRDMAVEQWRFNVATREALLDAGSRSHPSGGYFGPHGPEYQVAWDWHFPQLPRGCPDSGTCHHGCEPLAGCWRVALCAPLSWYGETWTPADRIAHERGQGQL